MRTVPPVSPGEMLEEEFLKRLGLTKYRLAKDIGKEEGEVKKIDAKLSNENFVARAPEEVIEENRDRRAEALAKIAKMRAALARLEQAG